MDATERAAKELIRRATTGLLNTEYLLIRAAHRIAAQQEADNWEYTQRNVTLEFAARFIAGKGFTYDQVMQMFS